MSKILIIEDEIAIAELEKDYLELSGFEVDVETQGDVGLLRALKEEIDLIILDLMLPGVDGFEICRKIRETKNTPIIIVSAKKDDIDKIRGLGMGADDYMTKPFSPSEMVARVKAHLARYERLVNSGMPSNDIIEIRGIKIDKTARRVWVNGEETNFTSKEFDLLTFLAQNPNHVYTKEELLEDFIDYLRARKLRIWETDSKEVEAMRDLGLTHSDSKFFVELAETRNDEVIANMAIVLLHQEDVLLRKHIEKQISRFVDEGGFRESLTKARTEKKKKK